MSMATTDLPDSGNRNDATTSSGVKLTFTAKGLLQPEVTLRYASAEEAMRYGAAAAFAVFDSLREQAAARHIALVTDQPDREAR